MSWKNRIVGQGSELPEALVANPRNWRLHSAAQRAGLVAVLDRIGWVQDVIVNRRTGHLVDGHLRAVLAQERGETAVPVLYVDLDEDEEALVLATLDPLAALADTDAAALFELLDGIQADDEAVQELLRTVTDAAGSDLQEPAAGESDPDEVPDLAAAIVSRTGDLWQLGDHRVLCGDATVPADVERLFGRERAAWMWTDPPYGVAYEGGTRSKLTLANDDAAGLPGLLAAAFGNADAVLKPGAPVYCAAPAGPLFLVFGQAYVGAGWHFHQTLTWVKDAFVLGRSDYHYRHEPVLYGWKPPGRRWYGGRSQDSVFEVSRPRSSPDHPTSKPVALVEAQLCNSSLRRAIGYDPFLGSGSTLLASERLGRRCYALELDPRYVDVAVRRWQHFTGRAAVLTEDGRTFAEVEVVRHGG